VQQLAALYFIKKPYGSGASMDNEIKFITESTEDEKSSKLEAHAQGTF
jgi:hypothetical protein